MLDLAPAMGQRHADVAGLGKCRAAMKGIDGGDRDTVSGGEVFLDSVGILLRRVGVIAYHDKAQGACRGSPPGRARIHEGRYDGWRKAELLSLVEESLDAALDLSDGRGAQAVAVVAVAHIG